MSERDELYYVQVASAGGLSRTGNIAAGLHESGAVELSPAELALVDQLKAEEEPSHGWNTVASVTDPRVAQAMAALVGMGIGSDLGMTGRAISAQELQKEGGLEALRRAQWAMQEPEREYGEMLRLAAEAVLDAALEPDPNG